MRPRALKLLALLAALSITACGAGVELTSPEFKRELTSGQDALAPDVADCAIRKLTAQGFTTEDEVPQEEAEKAGAECGGSLRRSPFREGLTQGRDGLSAEQADCVVEELTGRGYETVAEVPEIEIEQAGAGCARE